MEKKSRNILLISAVTVAVSGTIAVGMAAHAISKEKQPFVSLPWFMGKYERDERIKAINHLIKKAKESENVKDINRDFKETPKVDNINPKTSYICFGDDAPYGVNLMGENGYPELVAKKLNIEDFHNYACRTFGSNEIRRLIDENYKVPKHFENINKILFNDNTDIEAIREQIIQNSCHHNVP